MAFTSLVRMGAGLNLADQRNKGFEANFAFFEFFGFALEVLGFHQPFADDGKGIYAGAGEFFLFAVSALRVFAECEFHAGAFFDNGFFCNVANHFNDTQHWPPIGLAGAWGNHRSGYATGQSVFKSAVTHLECVKSSYVRGSQTV